MSKGILTLGTMCFIFGAAVVLAPVSTVSAAEKGFAACEKITSEKKQMSCLKNAAKAECKAVKDKKEKAECIKAAVAKHSKA